LTLKRRLARNATHPLTKLEWRSLGAADAPPAHATPAIQRGVAPRGAPLASLDRGRVLRRRTSSKTGGRR
jgi:hypothetical protein